jgi:hypothetical protein
MKTCAHCGKQFEVGGSLTIGGTLNKGSVTYPLCHPNEGGDCYRLVTVYGEPVGARKDGRWKLYDLWRTHGSSVESHSSEGWELAAAIIAAGFRQT